MANQAQKTEHSGPKKGSGAYWGRKKAAKQESNRVRRETDKKEANPVITESVEIDPHMHINHIFEEGELTADSVIKDFLTAASDGKNYQTKLPEMMNSFDFHRYKEV